MDKNTLWTKTKDILATSLSSIVYDSMIDAMQARSLEGGVLTLLAPSQFIKTSVDARYLGEIGREASSIAGYDIEIRVICSTADKPAATPEYERTNLRQKYNFDTFVPGSCNAMAYAAALAVANTPGQADNYNPLFLYGGVGLGKTHLIHSIGNKVFANNANLKVLYVTSDNFTDEFITSIREKTANVFKEKYRNCDVLLIDDVQFLAGKIETQEEMFHTFNNLYSAGKQIVLTSDLPPKDLRELEGRLTSRFASGLSCDVGIPDYETRTAILEKKLNLEKLDFPQDVKEFITRNIVSNIRDLEGALNKVMAYARLTNEAITLDLTQKALRDLISGPEKPVINMEYIKEVVCAHFGLKLEDLNGRKRTAQIVGPRQIAMYLCRKILDVSLPDVGKSFGGRDHTTVIHSCEKIAAELESTPRTRLTVELLESRIRRE